jgi:hypothetical protein
MEAATWLRVVSVPASGAGGEGFGGDAAHTLVRRSFHAEQGVDDLVVERSGGDARGGEVESGRDLEAAVTKDGSARVRTK